MTDQNADVQEVTTVSTPTTQRVVQQTRVVKPNIATGSPQKTYDAKKAIFRTYQVIWFILGVIEVVLAFRVILKMLGANAGSGFTDFIYAVSNPLALPFAGIVGITGGAVNYIEWSTLIAMAVYAIVAYGIVALLQFAKPTNPQEVSENVDNQ
jgi:hypothetical protein